jgi:hypothetical protein
MDEVEQVDAGRFDEPQVSLRVCQLFGEVFTGVRCRRRTCSGDYCAK